MKICHCLFWIKDKKIISVLAKKNGFEIMKFEGNACIEYTEDFWDKWKEYAGFLKTSQTDFCLIYDEKTNISEALSARECPRSECVWNRYMIQSVVERMQIDTPIQIYDEKGIRIAQTGNFRKKSEGEIVRMTASYRTDNEEAFEEKTETRERTPFIQYMIEKLERHDRQED
ncbi:MAG: hypothetical protein ACI4HI_00945 [Lachnospiraceae bacterium]